MCSSPEIRRRPTGVWAATSRVAHSSTQALIPCPAQDPHLSLPWTRRFKGFSLFVGVRPTMCAFYGPASEMRRGRWPTDPGSDHDRVGIGACGRRSPDETDNSEVAEDEIVAAAKSSVPGCRSRPRPKATAPGPSGVSDRHDPCSTACSRYRDINDPAGSWRSSSAGPRRRAGDPTTAVHGTAPTRNMLACRGYGAWFCPAWSGSIAAALAWAVATVVHIVACFAQLYRPCLRRDRDRYPVSRTVGPRLRVAPQPRHRRLPNSSQLGVVENPRRVSGPTSPGRRLRRGFVPIPPLPSRSFVRDASGMQLRSRPGQQQHR